MTAITISPYEYHKALIELIKKSKQNFIVMGEILYHLKTDDNFQQAVGEGIDTWIDYVKQPEIGLSRGEANRLVQIYENFVHRLGFNPDEIAQVPIKNLHYLLPVVKEMEKSEDVKELLYEAVSLSQADFKERVYDIKNSEDRTYTYIIMKKSDQTGALTRVYDIESKDIKNAFGI